MMLLWILAFTALFALAIGLPFWYFSLRPKWLYDGAQQCRTQGNIPEALARLTKLHHDYPDHLPGAWRYAELLHERTRLAEAKRL
ncbi:MAG TPA: hypothetical protein PKM88_05960, partial [bacterium]|nr:hypothetical protein [bacterium]